MVVKKLKMVWEIFDCVRYITFSERPICVIRSYQKPPYLQPYDQGFKMNSPGTQQHRHCLHKSMWPLCWQTEPEASSGAELGVPWCGRSPDSALCHVTCSWKPQWLVQSVYLCLSISLNFPLLSLYLTFTLFLSLLLRLTCHSLQLKSCPSIEEPKFRSTRWAVVTEACQQVSVVRIKIPPLFSSLPVSC